MGRTRGRVSNIEVEASSATAHWDVALLQGATEADGRAAGETRITLWRTISTRIDAGLFYEIKLW